MEGLDWERLRPVLDEAAVVVFVRDLDGRYLYVNRALERLVGMSAAQVLGRPIEEVLPPEAAATVRASDREAIDGGRSVVVETEGFFGSGRRSFMNFKFPLLDASGRPWAVLGFGTDTSERRHREDALQAASLAVSSATGDRVFQELTRYLATILGVQMALVGRVTDATPRTIRTLGIYGNGAYRENLEYPLEVTPCQSVMGGDFAVVPRDVATLYPNDQFLTRLGAVGYAGYPLSDAAGRTVGVIAVLSRQPVDDPGLFESVLKIFAVRAAAEIERRVQEEARAASEANYRAIFEAVEDAIFIHDYDTGAILDVNPKASSTYGYTREELQRMTVGDISGNEPPYTNEEALRLIGEVRAGRGPMRFEWRRRNRDGSLHWDEVTLKKVDIAGKPHILAMTHEITERKRTIEALRASEEQYRAMFNASADSLVLRDAEFRVVDVNPAYEAMSGRRKAEALGRDQLTMSPPELTEHVKGLHARALAGEPVMFEALARRKDGSRFNIETRGVPILHQGRPHVLYIGRDITARKTEEELLRASEEQYRAIFDGSADALVVWDSQLRRVDVNPAYEQVFGFTRAEVLAPDYDERVRPVQYADQRRELLRRTLAGERYQADFESVRKDGSRIHIEVRTIPIQYRGKPHVLAVSRDVTERKRAEAAVRASEEQYRAIFDASADAFVLWDSELRRVDVNPAYERIYGFTREEVLDGSYAEHLPLQYAERRRDLVRRTLAGERCQVELESMRKDGSRIEVEVRTIPIQHRGMPHVLAISRDITQRKRAEAAVRASEEQYRAIFNASVDGMLLWDADHRVVDVNQAFLRMHGYQREEMIGQTHPLFIPADLQAQCAGLLPKVLAGEPCRIEARSLRKDGSEFDVEIHGVPMHYRGRPHVLVILRDVTSRRQAEERLRASEERYRLLFEMESDAILVVDAETLDLIDMNPAAEKLWGYSRAELLRMKATDLSVEPEQTRATVQHGEGTLTIPLRRHRRKDGSEFLIEITANRFMLEGRKIVLAAIRDVSERKRREEALAHSEARLRATVEAAFDSVIGMDSAGNVIEFNQAAERQFGYRREQVRGRKLDELIIPPRLRAAHARGIAEYRATGEGPYIGRRVETVAMRADGSEFPVELAIGATRVGDDDIFVGYLRDISARKSAEAERSQLEAQLRQAQKMEAIGQLTGGIAHDFNNILQSILGNLTLADERIEELGDAKLARYLERAQLSAQRARELIQQMLTFSRGRRGEPRLLSPGPLVAEAAKLLRSSLPSTIEVSLDLEDETPPVKVDRVQAEQVLLNLCINARDAMRGEGSIALAVREASEAGGVCTACRQRFAGRFVELVVRDSGPGIAGEVVDRMFEPFFSTKEVGKGSGMGLSMVHGIVHEHGGHVIVETAPGRGAAFRVLFPVASGSAVSEEKKPNARVKPRLAGSVLVVDDEPMILEFMGDLLAGWGLEVTLKSSGLEAKHAFAAEPQRYDLVLTDHTMPRVTGLELARQIHGIRPGTPVILYTGYGEDIAEAQLAAAGVGALARKPVEPAELFTLLKTHLKQTRNTVK